MEPANGHSIDPANSGMKPILFGDSRSFIAENAMKDPTYNPYCGRCSGLVRMVKVEPFYWKCHCGAIHDIRAPKGESHVS